MSKKIAKRSLALGALMAFVITGSAMAANVDVAANVTKSDEAIISVGSNETFQNAGTVEAKTSITVQNGTFKNTGKIETGTLTISLNTANESVLMAKLLLLKKFCIKVQHIVLALN